MKLIKFDLPIDGVKVKTVEELREHFTPEILDHFRSGLLAKWLVSRKLQDELEAIKALDGAEDALLLKGLCDVFGIEADEAVIAAILNDPTPTFGLNIADAVKQSEDGDKIINLADLLPIQFGEMKLFANRLLAVDALNLEGTELILKSANGALFFKSCKILQLINDRYRDLGDGTVLDICTRLQWMRCALGQSWNNNFCNGESKKHTINQANKATDEFNKQGGYAGYCDWRLPSMDELKTLVYCSSCNPEMWKEARSSCQGDYIKPTIDPIAFPSAPISKFLCSSGNEMGEFYVDFSNGETGVSMGRIAGHVRLVRGGRHVDRVLKTASILGYDNTVLSLLR